MTTLFSEGNDNYVMNIREELTVFMNRSQVQIQENNCPELGQSFFEQINERFSHENQIIKYIAVKWNEFIDSWMATKESQQCQIRELHQQLQERDASNDNLQEIVSFLEKKIVHYEEQYDKLKTQLNTIIEKMQKMESQSLHSKNILQLNYQQAQMTCERQKNSIETLMNEKEILLDQIKYERKLNEEMEYQLSEVLNKFEQYERQCKIYEGKIQQSNKYCQQLECILNQKNQTILQLQNQIKQRNHKQLETVVSTQSLLDPLQKLQSVKLQDEIPFNEPFAYQFQRRLSELNFNPNRLLDDDTPVPSRMAMDPYFAHFVLTSQSVKIKQDCEQLLNIDAKPFYAQIVEKRVPMHLWDQWIRNKLKQVLKLRKAADSDSQDDQ